MKGWLVKSLLLLMLVVNMVSCQLWAENTPTPVPEITEVAEEPVAIQKAVTKESSEQEVISAASTSKPATATSTLTPTPTPTPIPTITPNIPVNNANLVFASA